MMPETRVNANELNAYMYVPKQLVHVNHMCVCGHGSGFQRAKKIAAHMLHMSHICGAMHVFLPSRTAARTFQPYGERDCCVMQSGGSRNQIISRD